MVQKASAARPRLWTRPIVPAVFLWLVALAIAFYGTHRFLMPWVAGRFKPTVSVPDLRGLKPTAAAAAVHGLGLSVVLDSAEDFNGKIPAGCILYQFPEAGTVVKTGRRIWLRISKGAQGVDLPELHGMSEREAEITLDQLGFRLGDIRYVASRSVPAGAVLGSNPGPHAGLRKGAVITISVSSGIEGALSMPSLLGLSFDQAKIQIAALHLSLGGVRLQADKKNASQTVLSQYPRPGAPLKGGSVDLVVSK